MTEPAARPTVVLVVFEWSVEYPLWDRSGEGFGPVDPATLGVSPDLAEQLRAWSDEHNDAPRGPENFEWPSARAALDWQRRGLHLAYALQSELGSDVEVRYAEDGAGIAEDALDCACGRYLDDPRCLARPVAEEPTRRTIGRPLHATWRKAGCLRCATAARSRPASPRSRRAGLGRVRPAG